MAAGRKLSLAELRQKLDGIAGAPPAARSAGDDAGSGIAARQPPRGLREYALRLLARRDYPRAELERKLKRRCLLEPADDYGAEFDAEEGDEDDFDEFAEEAVRAANAQAIAALVDELAARGLVSDARYADNRVRTRSARYGNARLEHELRRQGVDDEALTAAIANCDSEFARASALWRRRFGEAPADANERLRQMRYLAARGFSSDTVRRVVAAANAREEGNEEGTEEGTEEEREEERGGGEPC